jgi:hypothetical protein
MNFTSRSFTIFKTSSWVRDSYGIAKTLPP